MPGKIKMATPVPLVEATCFGEVMAGSDMWKWQVRKAGNCFSQFCRYLGWWKWREMICELDFSSSSLSSIDRCFSSSSLSSIDVALKMYKKIAATGSESVVETASAGNCRFISTSYSQLQNSIYVLTISIKSLSTIILPVWTGFETVRVCNFNCRRYWQIVKSQTTQVRVLYNKNSQSREAGCCLAII